MINKMQRNFFCKNNNLKSLFSNISERKHTPLIASRGRGCCSIHEKRQQYLLPATTVHALCFQNGQFNCNEQELQNNSNCITMKGKNQHPSPQSWNWKKKHLPMTKKVWPKLSGQHIVASPTLILNPESKEKFHVLSNITIMILIMEVASKKNYHLLGWYQSFINPSQTESRKNRSYLSLGSESKAVQSGSNLNPPN